MIFISSVYTPLTDIYVCVYLILVYAYWLIIIGLFMPINFFNGVFYEYKFIFYGVLLIVLCFFILLFVCYVRYPCLCQNCEVEWRLQHFLFFISFFSLKIVLSSSNLLNFQIYFLESHWNERKKQTNKLSSRILSFI